MKKFLAMLLVFAMVLSLVPMTVAGTALAADETVNSYEMTKKGDWRNRVYLKQSLIVGDEISFYVYIGNSEDPSGLSMYARGNDVKAIYKATKGTADEVDVYSGNPITTYGSDVSSGAGWYFIECVVMADATKFELSVDGEHSGTPNIAPGKTIIAGVKVNGVEVSSDNMYGTDGETKLTPVSMNIPSDLVAQYNPKIAGMTVSVGTDISVNCYVEDIPDGSRASVKFKVAGQEVKTVDVVADGTMNKATFKGLLPEQMGDELVMELYIDGDLADAKTTSVEKYLLSLKTDGSAKVAIDDIGTQTGKFQFKMTGVPFATGDEFTIVIDASNMGDGTLSFYNTSDSVFRWPSGNTTKMAFTVEDATDGIYTLKGVITEEGSGTLGFTLYDVSKSSFTEEDYIVIKDLVVNGKSYKPCSEADVAALGITDYSAQKFKVTYVEKVSSNTELVALVDAMLDYGAAAQIYRDYNVNDLVADGVVDNFVAPSSDKNSTSVPGAGVEFTSAKLWCDYANKIIFTFNPADMANNLTAKINGVDVDIVVEGGVYTVSTDDISALQFGDVYTAELLVGVETVATATYSVNSYVSAMSNGNSNLANLVKALYNYGVCAETYAN